MVEAGRHRENDKAARPPVDPVRLPDFSEMLALNPLMANPAAAMMAATAIGFGIANQMAEVFFGALQGVMEQGSHANGPTEMAEASAEAVVQPKSAAAEPQPTPATAKQRRKTVSNRSATTVAEPAPAAEKTALAKVKATSSRKPSAKKGGALKTTVEASAKPRKRKAAVAEADLKQISGIGPKVEKVLKEMGVASLAQVAAWSDADIGRFDKELGFDGRIARDGWVGQAQALLK